MLIVLNKENNKFHFWPSLEPTSGIFHWPQGIGFCFVGKKEFFWDSSQILKISASIIFCRSIFCCLEMFKCSDDSMRSTGWRVFTCPGAVLGQFGCGNHPTLSHVFHWSSGQFGGSQFWVQSPAAFSVGHSGQHRRLLLYERFLQRFSNIFKYHFPPLKMVRIEQRCQTLDISLSSAMLWGFLFGIHHSESFCNCLSA